MSESSNNAGTKKKSKRRRRGKNVGKGSNGAPKLAEEVKEMPKVRRVHRCMRKPGSDLYRNMCGLLLLRLDITESPVLPCDCAILNFCVYELFCPSFLQSV